MSDTLKRLPAVDRVLEVLGSNREGTGVNRDSTTRAARDVIADLRERIRSGAVVPDGDLTPEAVAGTVAELIATRMTGSLRPLINLTGIIVHTNLGRAPLSPPVLDEVCEILSTYNNLEFDLDAHERGSRYDHVSEMLLQLIPAEAALVVNNNAAAILLVLSHFAAGREVVVSRGELIEIGGGFRIPDVMTQSGARLVEVGTTNRTRIEDYERVLGPETAMIFKAHQSNFRMVGFTEETGYGPLAELARQNGLVFTADLGSGLLGNLDVPVSAEEPTPGAILDLGADLVCFSGDKLLGGPQAGVILGRADLLGELRQNPMLRALRVGKFTIAALEATLKRYLNGTLEQIPVIRAITTPADQVRRRCRSIVGKVSGLVPDGGLALQVVPTVSEMGGGTLPARTIPSFGIEVGMAGRSETSVEQALRQNDPPVMGRINGGRLVLDLRTLLPGQEKTVVQALAALVEREDEDE